LKKYAKIKGGFDKRIYQTAFDMTEQHPAYHIFKTQPDKYPAEAIESQNQESFEIIKNSVQSKEHV